MSSVTAHAAAASYASSGFSTRMGWGSHPALLLIDVCTAYFTPDSPLSLLSNPTATRSPASMRRLLAAARAAHIPIIWTTVQYTSPTMADGGLFWHKAKMLTVFHADDTRGLGGWVEGLVPDVKGGEVVLPKKMPSAFFGTTLASELHVAGVDTLVICGVSTSGCVRASALDAMQNGFRPMVVGEACGDRTEEIQRANLFDLDAKYADVVGEEEAVEKLGAGWV